MEESEEERAGTSGERGLDSQKRWGGNARSETARIVIQT